MGKDPCKETDVGSSWLGRGGLYILDEHPALRSGAREDPPPELKGLHGQFSPQKDRNDDDQCVLADTHQLGSEPRLSWQTVVSWHSLK